MIDIYLLRNPTTLKIVRESQKKRGASLEILDRVVDMDIHWRKIQFRLDKLRMKHGLITKTMGQLNIELAKNKSNDINQKNIKKEINEKLEEAKLLKEEISKTEVEVTQYKLELDGLLYRIGNIVHESVVDSVDENDNELIRTWPNEKIQLPNSKVIYHHDEVLTMLDGFDSIRGTKVAGHRGYFLKGWGLKLNLALIRYGMDFLEKKNYTLIQTPFYMKKDMMAKTSQLEDFDEQLFKVEGNSDENDKYLIATSEQPISAMHAGEWISGSKIDEKFVMRYCGYSTCFRKEAGCHGKDTWGIFRIHQFEKIEQFVLTDPKISWEIFEEMIENSEEFYQSLEIPYRIVSIVSGALNNAASKKYDLEAWFPALKEYKELVSCSNCTDYQSRRMEIRYGNKVSSKSSEKTYVHCLNATLVATERALCCILENYQTDDGLIVPTVLQPYLNDVAFIPYVKRTSHRNMFDYKNLEESLKSATTN